MPVIGFLSGRSAGEAASAVDAFREGLGKIGYIEGQNVTIEYRWAEGDYARLPALAAELVGRQVNVIAATGGDASGLAAKAATETIPIAFTIGGDPVELGLVVSLNKPGGNVTGVTFIVGDIATKRLGLLRQLVANAALEPFGCPGALPRSHAQYFPALCWPRRGILSPERMWPSSHTTMRLLRYNPE